MKVTIITVSYNSVASIADTIRSVLSQTYKQIEYIIVDGNSTDGTMQIVKLFEADFCGRLRYSSEPDKGIYDAMNKGLRMATGDVVGFLNSDDYFTTNDVISQLVAAFSRDDIDAVYGDVHFIHVHKPEKTVRYYSSKRFSPFWLRFGFMPAHPSFYLKRKVYEQVGGYSLDYKIGADFEMMVRLFHLHHISYRYLPIDCVTMRLGGASTRGYVSHKTLLVEDVKACREHGLYTNVLLVASKFLYKVLEFRW